MPNEYRNLLQIYTLTDQLNAVLDQLDENPELTTEEIQKALDTMTGDLNARVEDVALAIVNEEAITEAKRREISRLKELADREEGRTDKLRASLMALMKRAELGKLKGKLVNVTIANNGGKLPVEFAGDPTALPEHFRKTTIVTTLDYDAVINANTLGMDLPEGVKVLERGQHLRIK